MTTNSTDRKMMSLFEIPLNYTFTIRLENNRYKITSWLFLNFFTTIYYALICANSINLTTIIALGVFTLSIFYLYEWGYIYNDIKAIRHEIAPTLRVNNLALEYGNRHFAHITIIRFSVFTIGLLLTYLLIPTTNTLIATGLATICPLLFFCYNQWRSKYNVFLYFWLVASRFLPFAWLIESDQTMVKSLLILLIYPLEIGIERFSMPHYRYPIISKIIPEEQSKHLFRVFYYSMMLIVIGWLLSKSVINLELAFPFFLFWIYRCVIYLKQRQHADSLS